MPKYVRLTLITLLIIISNSLHLQQQIQSHLQSKINQQQQLDYVIAQQNQYAQGIRTLNTEAQNLRGRLKQTTDVNQRIRLLQTAITSQRLKLNQLSSSIIPDITVSRAQCQVLTQQQQKDLYDKTAQMDATIKQLESLTKQIPQCDQLRGLNQQIRKVKVDLSKVQQVISNQCQQNLLRASTVYQTNLYNNNNWTLGSYSMDQLIQQFYQNYNRYANISNCPLDRPFLPSSIPSPSPDACVRCPDYRPLFDVSIKSCISCPSDQSLDLSTRKCGYPPRNSNYTYGPNYKLQPLSQIPAPIQNLTSCPSTAPFYNGTLCVQCPTPDNYWQISQNKCYKCPVGQTFNLNIRQCVTKLANKKLTVLNNTKWITNDGNVTNVLRQRAAILQQNKTTGQYTLCPDQTPYFDSQVCVPCKENQNFNLNTLRCVTPPANLSYSPNLHRYVVPERKQMDPRTPRYITSQTLTDDPNIPNCNSTYPYYDQVSCVYCQQPFTLFDYDNKKCVICDPTSVYNQSQHQCIRRPSLYVFGNRDRLLATDTYTISDYNNTLRKAVADNPYYLPDKCPDASQYAAITKCVKCNPDAGMYFNVKTYQCVFCDGVPDDVTARCAERKYYFVNVNARNLLVPTGTTLDQIQRNNNQIIASAPTKYGKCPIEKPYPYNNKTICGLCPASAPLYSIQLQSCTYCPSNQQYDPRVHQCRPVIFLTNYDQNVIINPPKTLSSILQEQAQLNQTNITKKCPRQAPYTNDGKLCINCFEVAPYFDLQKGLCVGGCQYPKTYSPERKGCYQTYYLTNLLTPRLLQVENYTVANVRNQQNQLRQNTSINYKDCPLQQPYGQLSMCLNCTNENMVFNLKTQTCQYCPENTQYWADTRKCEPIVNITNLNSTNAKFIQSDTFTLSNYKTQIQRQKLRGPTRLCPNQLPYAIQGVCRQCPEDMSYFVISTKNCGACYNYHVDSMTCPPKPNRYPNLTHFYWITNDGNADKYINNAHRLKQVSDGLMCPAFYNQTSKDCIDCAAGQYYNYDSKVCQRCPGSSKFDINIHVCVEPMPTGSYFTNIRASPNQLEIYGGLTLDQIQTTQNQIKNQYSDSRYCPTDKPFFDNFQCISCPEYKKYFNLRHKLCQVCLFGQQHIANDCVNQAGNKVWQEPIAQNVYPFLFSGF